MKDSIISLFNDYSSIIIFLHVLSAIVWVGGMIALRFAVHFTMQSIDKPQVKLKLILDYLQRFFNIVRPLIGLLLVTAIIMTFGLGFKNTPLYIIVHLKEAIWTIMTIVFIIIYVKRNTAQMYFDANDFKSSKQTLEIIAKYLIPINIILGLIALYFGIALRGL